MSAVDVIQQIKNLPREERELVERFVRSGEEPTERQIRQMDPARAKDLSGKIFSENTELFRKLSQ
jgi:hypothetical protein